MSTSGGWLTPINPSPTGNPMVGIAFHFGIAVIALIIVIVFITLLANTTKAPAPPTGAIGKDYDALITSRSTLRAYMDANTIADTTPMLQFQIATANFGGIFTEATGPMNPWIGTVSPDAARLQVAAGARAIVFDIWPDPADRTNPVVCAMADMNSAGATSWWRNTGGLNKGVGRYSNWQLVTRNKVDAATMITAACNAAFRLPNGQQNNDPFFLILRLHGAMTTAYLNKLGSSVQRALGGHAMSASYSGSAQQRQLCSTPVSEFLAPVNQSGGYGFVIVCPDISPGYNILPGVNTYSGFLQQFQATTLGEVTNAVEQNANTLWFDPMSIGALTQASQPGCSTGAAAVTPPQAGFSVVQPSVGSHATDNDTLLGGSAFQSAQQAGAQMVAVNLFSHKSQDTVLSTWFNTSNFGTYSFKKGT